MLLCWAAASWMPLPAVQAQQPTNVLRVVSAKRTNAYWTRTGTIRARDAAEDVVLVLRVQGLSRAEFRRLPPDEVRVLAGEEQLPPNVVATGVVENAPELVVVVVGPRSRLDMALVLGTYGSLAFRAEETVSEEIR